jgi:hypothetical protein
MSMLGREDYTPQRVVIALNQVDGATRFMTIFEGTSNRIYCQEHYRVSSLRPNRISLDEKILISYDLLE